MNIEFHYYAIYFLALRAGLSDDQARTVAYSSQLVDHNIISYRVATPGAQYLIEPTQNYGFWDDRFPRDVYIPFHFFPGDPDAERSGRIDGQTNPMNTTPDSPRVRELLVDALKTRNLYRVGIALHTYADSWAHQNFSGRLESWNRIDPNSPIPPIGHAQALGKPDNVALQWEDPRIAPEYRAISNRDRFLRAARQIYKFLATFNRRPFDDLEFVEWDLVEILGEPGQKPSGTERINDFIIHDTMTPYRRGMWLSEAVNLPNGEADEELFRGYSKLLWLRDAVLYRSKLIEQRPVHPKPGFESSHFHRWHEATKEHRTAAWRILADR